MIVSHSAEIRRWSRAMLISVGLDPTCLCDIDSSEAGWQDRLSTDALVISDIISARDIPRSITPRVFRLIADSSLEELKHICSV